MQNTTSSILVFATACVFAGLCATPARAAKYSGGAGSGYGASLSTPTSMGAAALSFSMPHDLLIERTLQSVACPAFTVMDATPSAINATDGLRLAIPSGLPFCWDSSVGTPVFGGSAAAKVAAQVHYEDNDRTLAVTVATAFADGDTLTIAGLAFTNLIEACPPAPLALDISANGFPDAHTENYVGVTVPRPGGLGSGDTSYVMMADVKLVVPQGTLFLLR